MPAFELTSYPYDFHIHSCLSPCGDNDMTPQNLVNMAALSGCELIALTDHNSCKNAPAAMKVGEQCGVLVLPGMELCTAEEAHVVCLFETLDGAMQFDRYVYDHMPHIKNKPEIFGEQLILNENDELIGVEENLLLVSSFLSVNELPALTAEFGGVAVPAHLNRDSYSVLSALGALPVDVDFPTIELSADCDREAFLAAHPELATHRILRSSDAHYLESLAGAPRRIHLKEKSERAVIALLREQ